MGQPLNTCIEKKLQAFLSFLSNRPKYRCLYTFLLTYTGRKYDKSLYSTLLHKSYVNHLSWIVKKSIKTYALHLMINPTHKQRLEVSKKVPYITLGHEAAKLEAVKLWGHNKFP